MELDQQEAVRLPADMRAQLKPIWDINPQGEVQMRGRLFV